LPPDLRQALDSTEIYEDFQEISKKHGLHIDKAGILEEEVTIVLLGLMPSSKLVARLHENMGISSEEAQNIAQDVNETIFKDFRESLMKIHSENTEIKPANVVNVEAPIQTKSDGETEKIDREELLREIEKMDELGSRQTGDSGQGAVDGIDKSNKLENLAEIKTFSAPAGAAPKSIIEEKLSGPMRSTAEEIKLTRGDEKTRPDPGRRIDPYREPLD
jgi:hypothetical protein